jgi:hypothetical protein
VDTFEAKFYDKSVIVHAWRTIVLHCTASSEVERGAWSVAKWFANPWDPKKKQWIKASAHIICDNRTTIHCVPEYRHAYHARGYNYHSLGIEIVGSASQSRDQWLDQYSLDAMLKAAREVARLAGFYRMPIDRFLTDDEVRGYVAGLTTHRAVSRALQIPGGHVDPGPNFPEDKFLEMVAES